MDECTQSEWCSEMDRRLSKLSKTNYCITRGSHISGTKILFKTIRHCHHKRKRPTVLQLSKQSNCRTKDFPKKSTRDKKTNCPSTLIRLYPIDNQKISSHPNHRCLVDLHYVYNHPVDSGHVLSFRPVADAVKQEYLTLFETGNSAAASRHEYTKQLQLKHDVPTLEHILADRSVNPNCQDIQRLFRKWRENHIGPENGEEMFSRLTLEVSEYNKVHANDGGKAFIQRYRSAVRKLDANKKELHDQSLQPPTAKMKRPSANIPFILAIVTPIMARAHHMAQQSGELVYCDSTASLDNLNTAVFILSCSTSAGAIPLGAVMTSREDTETLVSAFMALSNIMPDCAFFGRGKAVGPLTFLTDDCASERKALKLTWPQAQLHRCVFHFLQSMWRWLWSSKSLVSSKDRVSCMLLTKRLVYANSGEALNNIKVEIEQCQLLQYKKRIEDYWTRKTEWALCLRKNFPTRGNYTKTMLKQALELQKTFYFKELKLETPLKCFE